MMKEVAVPLKTTVAVASEVGASADPLPVPHESTVDVLALELVVLLLTTLEVVGTPVPREIELVLVKVPTGTLKFPNGAVSVDCSHQSRIFCPDWRS